MHLNFFFRSSKKNKHSMPEENAEWNEEDAENVEHETSTNIIVMQEKKNIPTEFIYLKNLISYRLGSSEKTEFPPVSKWDLPVKDFLQKMGLDKDEDISTLILIGLVPHALPELFDQPVHDKINAAEDFPEIGGVRGKNFRGFLPTGQTAVFLLAGNDWQRRIKVEQFFWSDKDLARKKILWLEQMEQGEPAISGRITMALDYIDLFLFGTSAPPHFGTSFPAKKITTQLKVEDIMMNKEVKRHYKNLKEWIDHNPSLMNEWGMNKRLRQGFRVLFYGPPGTGKTLTANVLGNETGKDVYKIDISMVVSKYIGETEKNLELLFARAQEKDWILFFDEADSIFGKRTGVRDAQDKYANQEVSYLLQRIEEFDGLVILSTNMKSNIDDAFIRRFNDVVKFSIPTEDEREEIWRKSFPEKSDHGDIPGKVKKYELAGGNIINIVHYASLQAVKKRKESLANEKKPEELNDTTHNGSNKLAFHIEDVMEGIRREMIKDGKPFSA